MAFPGEERLRQWGPHWGKARGDRGLPLEGLGARDGGLQWWLHGEGADSGGLDCGGGGPAALDGGKRVGEHQRMSRKLFAGFVGREEGWRRELRGEQTTTAVMAGGGRPLGQGARLGALLGARRGRGRRKCEHPTRGEGSGRFQGETRVRRSRTGRHGVAVAVRRHSSACAHGNGDAWRSREATGEAGTGRDEGAARGRWPRRRAPKQGREREMRE